MSGKAKNPLRQAVRQALLWRIGLSVLGVAIGVGAIAFLTLRNEVGAAAIDHALLQIQRFHREADLVRGPDGALDPDQLQREIEEFSARQPLPELGSFVLVELHGLQGEVLARVGDPLHPMQGEVEAIFAEPLPTRLEEKGQGHRGHRLGGRPHLEVMVPFRDPSGELLGSIRGMFAPSAETVAATRKRMLRSVGLGVLIVLITAAVIYPIVMELVRRLTRFSAELLTANLETLQVLGSAVAKRDKETQAHSARVTITSVRLAEKLGLDPHELRSLIKGALLHDVGKVAIGDQILLKPGKLTDDEYSVMKTHVTHGAEIVERAHWLATSVDVVRYHHERFDGSGYMTGIGSNEIPISARIFAIADVFDALTSERPYKEAISLERSMEILDEGRGSHFDPDLVDAFHSISGDLYAELHGKSDDELTEHLHRVIRRYFTGSLEVLEA